MNSRENSLPLPGKEVLNEEDEVDSEVLTEEPAEEVTDLPEVVLPVEVVVPPGVEPSLPLLPESPSMTRPHSLLWVLKFIS